MLISPKRYGVNFVKKTAFFLVFSLLTTACMQMPANNAANGQPRPAFKDSTIGMATVTGLIVAMEVKRQKTQESLRKQTTPDGISKYQARLTAMDSVKNNLVSYSSGQLSLGDKISLVNATSDLVRTKLPEYGDIISTLSTLSQVLMTAQHQAMQAAQQASGQ